MRPDFVDRIVFRLIGPAVLVLLFLHTGPAEAKRLPGPPDAGKWYALCWKSHAPRFVCRWLIPGVPPSNPDN